MGINIQPEKSLTGPDSPKVSREKGHYGKTTEVCLGLLVPSCRKPSGIYMEALRIQATRKGVIKERRVGPWKL